MAELSASIGNCGLYLKLVSLVAWVACHICGITRLANCSVLVEYLGKIVSRAGEDTYTVERVINTGSTGVVS